MAVDPVPVEVDPQISSVPLDIEKYFERLRAAGSPITGLTIGDPADDSTWLFHAPFMRLGDVQYAVALAHELMTPAATTKDGDVPATVTEQIPPPRPAPRFTILSDEVANLLATSRAAHTAWRQARTTLLAPGEERRLLESAARTRAGADALDPSHRTPAWATDAKTHPHKELTAFYAEMLSKQNG